MNLEISQYPTSNPTPIAMISLIERFEISLSDIFNLVPVVFGDARVKRRNVQYLAPNRRFDRLAFRALRCVSLTMPVDFVSCVRSVPNRPQSGF